MSSTTLVIQTAFLGDVVLSTPLLSALAAQHGPVDVVTTPIAAPLLETHPAVRRVIPYDKRGSDRGWAGVRLLAGRLKAEQYARAYLPHRSLRTAALACLARIPSRRGFSGGWSFLYTEARSKPRTGHESDRLLALANEAPGAYPPQLRPTAADDHAAGALVHGPFVALAPGSIWGSKRWPHYTELATKLAIQVQVVVVGGKDDVELGGEIVRAAGRSGGRAVNACGKLTLRQSAALIGRAAVLVTNDSAPLHLATAMGTPVVALFGPTVTEFGFGPMRPDDVALGVDGLLCRPCSSHGPPQCPLGHHRCMRELTVEAVTRAIEDLGALRRRN
ncbi:MAG: lipopolysaccharide heptosyltransferase II [Gemmatimonadetes bacterium 13_1_40CM_66_11]|nr:MAG: lipopolysaccharide heptosyltransferase II [Gemmatimonadetes bacterium 13_1_40CM_66_11]